MKLNHLWQLTLINAADSLNVLFLICNVEQTLTCDFIIYLPSAVLESRLFLGGLTEVPSPDFLSFLGWPRRSRELWGAVFEPGALSFQVDVWCSQTQQRIVGYYQANACMSDSRWVFGHPRFSFTSSWRGFGVHEDRWRELIVVAPWWLALV